MILTIRPNALMIFNTQTVGIMLFVLKTAVIALQSILTQPLVKVVY